MRRKRLYLGLYMLLVLSICGGSFAVSRAAADPGGRPAGTGYFTGADAPSYGNSIILGGLSSSAQSSKSGFISFIKNKLDDGGRNRTGAQFIIQLMRGNPSYDHNRPSDADIADWEDRINQSNVTMSVQNMNYTWDAAYDSGHNDDYFYNGPSLNAPTLVFRQNGSIVFEIRTPCANPLGNLPGIAKPQGWSLSVTSYVGISGKKAYTTSDITANVGDVIQFKHTVKNNGDGMATYNRWQMLSGAGGTSYTDGTHVNDSKLAGHDSVDWPSAANRNHTVTASQAGKKYCARYAVDPRSSTNSAELDSDPVCYTVGTVPITTSSCPVQGTTMGYISFGSGNNGEVTYSPSGWDSHTPPWGFPRNGDTYAVRYATSYTASSATVPDVGPVPVVGGNRVDFTRAIALYPYDTNTAQVTYTDTYYTYVYKYTVDSKGVGSWSSSSSGPRTSGSFSDGSATLGECNYRTFNIDPTGSNSSWLPDYEHPSQANGTYSATSTFGYNGPTPPRSPRSPSRVNGIGVGISQVYIRHSDGSRIPVSDAMSSYNFDYSGQSQSGSQTITAPQPLLRYGDRFCFTAAARPGAGLMDQYGNVKSVDVYENTAGSETCSEPMAARPYLRIFGGDVLVGGGVQQTNPAGTISTCPAISNATINAWNRGPSGSYAGSGGQYAVQALGLITSFSSNLANPSANPAASGPRPRGLTFANTTGTYGGSYGAVPGCRDYATDPPPLTEKLYGDQITDTTWLGMVDGKGQHVTKYVYGNVYITGNIVYTNSGIWNSPKEIPTFKLVAIGGNIYVAPWVTQLDGMYVATKTSSGVGGSIITCANGYSAMPETQLFNSCADPLTVNGSFVADKVQLLRTRGQNGSNWQSSVSETPYDSRAAEIFNYTPEQWIAQPPSNHVVEYDALTSLGPVL